MIKNIIFDMGNVLIHFDPDVFIRRVGIDNPEDAKILKREIYSSVEWAMMDRGTLSVEEASKIMQSHVPDYLKPVVKKLMVNWDRPIMPFDGAKELIKELKENGYKIYLLSNAALNQVDYWNDIPGSEYFDGTVVSSFIKLVKPQMEIFQYLIDKFNLKKKECIFIDDSIMNAEASIYFGMKAIVFHGDYSEVRRKLIDNGVNVTK